MRIVTGALLALVLMPLAAAQIESYASLPEIWAAELSPDGAHLATGCTPRGPREICIYDLVNGQPPIVLPAPDGARVVGFFWPSNTHLMFESVSFERTAYSSGLAAETIRHRISYSLADGNLARFPSFGSYRAPMLQADNRIAWEMTYDLDTNRDNTTSQMRARNDFGTVVYEIDLNDGDVKRTLETSEGSTVQFLLEPSGEPFLDIRYSERSGEYSIHRTDLRHRSAIYSGAFEAAYPSVYGLTVDRQAIAIRIPRIGLRRLDIATGELTEFDGGGLSVNMMGPKIDPYSETVVGFGYTDDLNRQIFIDPDLAALHDELKQILSENSVTIGSWSADRSKMVVIGRDAGQPANYYLLDLETGSLGGLGSTYSRPDGLGFPSTEAIAYEASDGLEIPGYLTLPPGETRDSGPFPLIVMPHGGPQARTTARFDWWTAYLASLGYAVLQPNYRGSLGYGTEFLEAGYGGFGTRMIDDISDGARAMREARIAQEGDYCVSGASYGGYAAMMLAIRDADNVGCVISFAGVADPFSMLADLIDDPADIRYWELYMGSRFSDSEYRASISPASRPGDIQSPILVLHGDADTTVSFNHFRQLQTVLATHPNARFVRMEDVDHYLGSAESRAQLLRESEVFLREHLPAQ